jgi:exosortase E/protease (VPEID-CTERM system)
MLSEGDQPPTRAALPPLSRRWLGLLALLAGEYLWMSMRFDAQPLMLRAGVSGIFGYLGVAAPLFVVIAGAIYLLAGERLRADAALLVDAQRERVPLWPCLLVNLASYAGLYALTQSIVALPLEEDVLPTSWIVGWLGLSLLTALSLLAAAVPWRAALPLLRRTFGLLLAGAGAGVLAWIAGIASNEMFETLTGATLVSVYAILYPFAHGNIIYQPDLAILGVGDFFIEVSPVCSGFEGIGLIFVFTIVYLASARHHLRFPRALLLIPLAIVLVWIGNAVRIALLIAVGKLISPEIALSGFHSKAGWLFFVAVALSMIALAQRSSYFSRAVRVDDQGVPTWNPTATYLAPQLALIGSTLVMGLLSTGFDHFYAVRVLAVALALYVNREHLPAPRWPPSWHAPVIGVVVFVVWILVVPHPKTEDLVALRLHLAQMSTPVRALYLTMRVIGFSITVPIAEELAFRAFLLRRLVSADFLEVPKDKLTPFALIVSSLAFGALHDREWVGGTIAGLAYALAQRARGRTADAVVAHAITNAIIAVDVLAFGQDWLWVH